MLGFEGFDLPEDAGGAGLGMLSRIRTNRLLAEADAGAALALDRFAPAVYVIEAFGGIAALKSFEAMLGRPDSRFALVMDDGAGSSSGGHVEGEVAWVPATLADVLGWLGQHGAWELQAGF